MDTFWSRLFCYIYSTLICCNLQRTPPRSKPGHSIIDWISSLLLSIKGSGHPEVINRTLVINFKWNEALVFLVWFFFLHMSMYACASVFSTIVSIVSNHRSKKYQKQSDKDSRGWQVFSKSRRKRFFSSVCYSSQPGRKKGIVCSRRIYQPESGHQQVCLSF